MADEILVEFFDDTADELEIDYLTRGLQRELGEIPEVDDVSQASAGPAPEGTRGLTLAAIGALVVSLKPTVELMSRVIDVARAWLNRPSVNRTMRITINGQTIELTPTQEQQEALVRKFLEEAMAASGSSSPDSPATPAT